MDIGGKNALVLGGAGLVGTAVCLEILEHGPACLIVAAHHRNRAERTCKQLLEDFPNTTTRILPVWGDLFVRAEWQSDQEISRADILLDATRRKQLIADILDPLDDEILNSSTLSQIILGTATGLGNRPADIIVDCVNTATAISYQNIFDMAASLIDRQQSAINSAELSPDVERLIASLYIPQLVRHLQILYEAMRRAKTTAYVKVGTSGSGGMGFNIPYTHGEEQPSRLLLSKAALAGAQTLLTFLMARTPDGPSIVREIKPTALIGWREIGHGPIRRAGKTLPLFDCLPEEAVAIREPENLIIEGDFGVSIGKDLSGVYIETGENGYFSAAEFATITAVGQMQLVTPEEIAQNVTYEITGGATGHDIITALDAAVMEPSFRGGYLRQFALNRLSQLEAEHGEAVAFEILGPPRLSKLLYEAYLIKSLCQTTGAALAQDPATLAKRMEQEIIRNPDLRQRIISIGIGILLADGERLLRGPLLKSHDAQNGWIDLTVENLRCWQQRLRAIQVEVQSEKRGDNSSRSDRMLTPSRDWRFETDIIDVGEAVAWILVNEEQGQRLKG